MFILNMNTTPIVIFIDVDTHAPFIQSNVKNSKKHTVLFQYILRYLMFVAFEKAQTPTN